MADTNKKLARQNIQPAANLLKECSCLALTSGQAKFIVIVAMNSVVLKSDLDVQHTFLRRLSEVCYIIFNVNKMFNQMFVCFVPRKCALLCSVL